MTSNGDAVLDIPIQGHDPTPTPTLTGENELMAKIRAEITDRLGQQNNSSDDIIKIQKVPRIMFQQKKFEEDYYIPREMPIGPIYAEEENSEPRQLKLKLAAQFIITTSSGNCDRLLQRIKSEIGTLKKKFDRNLVEDFSDDKLASMLLLDGCSVLQFIYSRVKDELKEFQINYGQASVIEQDLFLMANQIPFRVLEILMDSLPRTEGAFTSQVFIDSIDRFIRMNLMTRKNLLARNYDSFYEQRNNRPLHLLDIFYSGFLYGFNWAPQSDANPGSKKEFNNEYFRNIQELKAVGIKLKSSESSCLRDVTFSSVQKLTACLKIPPLIVDDSTGRKLWNLIAYEMCPDNCNSEFGVTSYLSLLDSLIDSEEDVKDLRSAHILRHRLSCDADVAKLFNEIGYNVVSDQAYRKVKEEIQRHWDNWFAKNISELNQKHLGSPWKFFALCAAIVGLVFASTQIYYTIHRHAKC